jgi:hypothetical protein
MAVSLVNAAGRPGCELKRSSVARESRYRRSVARRVAHRARDVPIEVPRAASDLARRGWLVSLTAARSAERWQLLEVGFVYP